MPVPARDKQYRRGVAFFCECGDHAWGALTSGHVTFVDVADAHLLKMLLHASVVRGNSGAEVYAAITNGADPAMYAFAARRGPTGLHRVIMQAPANRFVDHKNGDKVDNRRRNLRLATQSQNAKNIQRKIKSLSGYRGVSFNRPKTRYHAGVNHNGAYHYAGTFDTTVEAAMARDALALELHGEFAFLNYPLDHVARRAQLIAEVAVWKQLRASIIPEAHQ